jgi:hypothetical protein
MPEVSGAVSIGLLVAALAAWVGVLCGIVWTWNRHVAVMADSGQHFSEADRRIDVGRVIRRHTLGWTLFYAGFFALMDLASFPLWQRLGFAVVLAVVYGTTSMRREEEEWIEAESAARPALFGRVRDAIWYRVLAVGEWAAYLGSTALAADLLVGALD